MGMMNRKELKLRKPGEKLKCSAKFGPAKTKQEYREETDINRIISRFRTTGELTHIRKSTPQFVDCTSVPEFGDIYLRVRKAEDQFMSLPARVRARFENDPQKFYEFVQDEKNREEAEYLGLVPKKDKVEPKAPDAKPEVAPKPPKEVPPAS